MPLVVLGGTGDVYLVCALVEAFCAKHGRPPYDVEVVVKAKFAAVAQLFPAVRCRIDDAMVDRAQGDRDMQQNYDNMLHFDGRPFYTHPCFVRSRARVDHMTTKPEASQADMYRMLLGVSPAAPLTLPVIPRTPATQGSVLLVPEAVSWPNDFPSFWVVLADCLRAAGWQVAVNDPHWPLQELFARAAGAEWVLGPQCGFMSILCTGQFPCRKSVVTPSVDDFQQPEFLARETYPYGYVTKFAGEDYDVEEFKLTAFNHAEVIDALLHGQNALRIAAHDPRPVTTISLPLTPGDALDRTAVLSVKRSRFLVHQRAGVEREYQRHMEATRVLRQRPEIAALYARMVALHLSAFDRLERMVPAATERRHMEVSDHVDAVAANRLRIALKQEADVLCRAPYHERKSYYVRPRG